jgi:hypothetical protein
VRAGDGKAHRLRVGDYPVVVLLCRGEAFGELLRCKKLTVLRIIRIVQAAQQIIQYWLIAQWSVSLRERVRAGSSRSTTSARAAAGGRCPGSARKSGAWADAWWTGVANAARPSRVIEHTRAALS